jgi:hypothetical protein
MPDYATLNRCAIDKARERGRRWNQKNQASKASARLASALEFGPVRPVESVLCGELAWHNARSGQRTLLELWKEPDGSNFRFTVYVDGRRWRNGWSRTAFVRWFMARIERVMVDWS